MGHAVVRRGAVAAVWRHQADEGADDDEDADAADGAAQSVEKGEVLNVSGVDDASQTEGVEEAEQP